MSSAVLVRPPRKIRPSLPADQSTASEQLPVPRNEPLNPVEEIKLGGRELLGLHVAPPALRDEILVGFLRIERQRQAPGLHVPERAQSSPTCERERLDLLSGVRRLPRPREDAPAAGHEPRRPFCRSAADIERKGCWIEWSEKTLERTLEQVHASSAGAKRRPKRARKSSTSSATPPRGPLLRLSMRPKQLTAGRLRRSAKLQSPTTT